jgi:uncharacterized delta-60 repeat protein
MNTNPEIKAWHMDRSIFTGVAASLLVLCGSWTSKLHAQTPVSFHTEVNGAVNTLAVQPDGKILIGWKFTSVAGQASTNIARLLPDGRLDPTFSSDSSAEVYAIAVQDDGKLMIQGPGSDKVWRLQSDGSLDTTFQPFTSASVYSMVLQPDQKLLLNSTPFMVDGKMSPGLVRLITDGSIDTSFVTDLDTKMTVTSVGLERDGRILAGFAQNAAREGTLGRFDQNGKLEKELLDSPDIIGRILPQRDNILLMHGWGLSRLAQKLSTEDTLVPSFSPRLLSGASMALQSDGKILVVNSVSPGTGESTTANLCRLNEDGTLDLAFPWSGKRQLSGPLALEADGGILVASQVDTGGPATNYSEGYVERFVNPTPATEALLVSGTTITWLRGGSAPLAWRTSFERSSDGENWSALGAGELINGGWQLSAADIQTGDVIRARGYVHSGNKLAEITSSYVESRITVGAPLTILRSPANRTNYLGTAAQFGVAVAGAGPVDYQWQKDGVDLPGATASMLAVTNIAETDAGTYAVVASNSSGSVTSAPARLEVTLVPGIVRQPFNLGPVLDETKMLTVQAAGATPLKYQWLKDGANIAGETNATLTLANITLADEGSYTVVVSNQYGSVSSVASTLDVVAHPTIAITKVSNSAPLLHATSERAFKMIVERSGDLTHWETVRELTTAMGNASMSFTDGATSGMPMQFYRVKVE